MEYKKGRGAQINTRNKFQREEKTREHVEAIDDWTDANAPTQYIEQEAKSIVNKVDSPDVGMFYSMNPYADVNTAVFTVMPGTRMNTGVTAQGLISNRRSSSRKMRRNCFGNFS